MKYLILILLASTLAAQEGGIPPALSAKFDQLATRLQLTAEQRPRAEAILLQYAERVAANPPADKAEKVKQRRALRRKIAQLLTPEQQQLMRQKKGGRPAIPQPEPGGDPGLMDSLQTTPGTVSPSTAPAASSFTAPATPQNTLLNPRQNWLDTLLDEIILPLLQRRKN